MFRMGCSAHMTSHQWPHDCLVKMASVRRASAAAAPWPTGRSASTSNALVATSAASASAFSSHRSCAPPTTLHPVWKTRMLRRMMIIMSAFERSMGAPMMLLNAAIASVAPSAVLKSAAAPSSRSQRHVVSPSSPATFSQ